MKKYITRTIVFSHLEIVALNETAMQRLKKTVDVPIAFKTDKEAMRYIEERYQQDDVRVVSVKVLGYFDDLYGMDLEAFIQNAERLDPRKVKETGIEMV